MTLIPRTLPTRLGAEDKLIDVYLFSLTALSGAQRPGRGGHRIRSPWRSALAADTVWPVRSWRPPSRCWLVCTPLLAARRQFAVGLAVGGRALQLACRAARSRDPRPSRSSAAPDNRWYEVRPPLAWAEQSQIHVRSWEALVSPLAAVQRIYTRYQAIADDTLYLGDGQPRAIFELFPPNLSLADDEALEATAQQLAVVFNALHVPDAAAVSLCRRRPRAARRRKPSTLPTVAERSWRAPRATMRRLLRHLSRTLVLLELHVYLVVGLEGAHDVAVALAVPPRPAAGSRVRFHRRGPLDFWPARPIPSCSTSAASRLRSSFARHRRSATPAGQRRDRRAAVRVLVPGAEPARTAGYAAEGCLMPLISIHRRRAQPAPPLAIPNDSTVPAAHGPGHDRATPRRAAPRRIGGRAGEPAGRGPGCHRVAAHRRTRLAAQRRCGTSLRPGHLHPPRFRPIPPSDSSIARSPCTARRSASAPAAAALTTRPRTPRSRMRRACACPSSAVRSNCSA